MLHTPECQTLSPTLAPTNARCSLTPMGRATRNYRADKSRVKEKFAKRKEVTDEESTSPRPGSAVGSASTSGGEVAVDHTVHVQQVALLSGIQPQPGEAA